nr:hypothetical protein [Desulfobacula sp.]
MINPVQNCSRVLAALLGAVIFLGICLLPPALAQDRPYHRLVILGDPHLPGRLIEKKEAVLETVNAWEDVDLVIAVGDICSDWGSDEEYRAAGDFFKKLKTPFFPIAGNHDYIYETPARPDGGLVTAPRPVQEAKLQKFRETFDLPDYFYRRMVGGYLLLFLSSDHVDFLSGMSNGNWPFSGRSWKPTRKPRPL